MKTAILVIGIGINAIIPALGQGYIDFSWFGNGLQGIQVGFYNTIPSQSQGWYVAGDYTVEAFMAAGANQPESSLVPIASTKTTFLGGATTTASGTPIIDGSGLWQAGTVDTGLPVGAATIQVRAWYDPNHNLTWDQVVGPPTNIGKSTLYNINTVKDSNDPNLQSLDDLAFQVFVVEELVPEPSTFVLAFVGFTGLLINTRKRWLTLDN